MQRLNPKAVGAYMQTLDYEAHTLIQSLFLESKSGTSPVNPANYAGRFALKSVSAPRPGRSKLTTNEPVTCFLFHLVHEPIQHMTRSSRKPWKLVWSSWISQVSITCLTTPLIDFTYIYDRCMVERN